MPQRSSLVDATPVISRLNLHLPLALRRRLDKHLFVASEHRVPKGAYQHLIVRLLTKYLESQP